MISPKIALILAYFYFMSSSECLLQEYCTFTRIKILIVSTNRFIQKLCFMAIKKKPWTNILWKCTHIIELYIFSKPILKTVIKKGQLHFIETISQNLLDLITYCTKGIYIHTEQQEYIHFGIKLLPLFIYDSFGKSKP